jgi:hypothetical protein
VAVIVASLVILDRRGSDLDLRLQAAAWAMVLLAAMVLVL